MTLVTTPTPQPVLPEEQLFDRLSVHDRVAQLIAVPVNVSDFEATDSATLSWVNDHRPGFVTLFGSDISATEAATAVSDIRSRYSATLSAMVMVDHEGGTVQRLNGEGFTSLPAWRTLCAQDASASAELLQTSAQELKKVGVEVVLAPVVDVGQPNTPLSSRICSDNPETVTERAENMISTFQQVGLTPVLKHFPGLGSSTKDLHFAFDRVTITEGDTFPYLKILEAHPEVGVMVSHPGVTNQDPDVPCSLSSNCVGQILSNYPQTLVFTDALEMKSAEYQPGTTDPKPLDQRVSEAILAGNDVLVFGEGVDTPTLSTLLNDLETAYYQSPTLRAQIDDSVKKIITFKVKKR